MHEFQYDCVKPNMIRKKKRNYVDTGTFIVHVKQVTYIKSIGESFEKTPQMMN